MKEEKLFLHIIKPKQLTVRSVTMNVSWCTVSSRSFQAKKCQQIYVKQFAMMNSFLNT